MTTSASHTRAGLRGLHGAAVTITLYAEGCASDAYALGRETGRVWCGAPTVPLLGREVTRDLREAFAIGAADRKARDTVWVMLTGGRVARAEVNLGTLQGYGVVIRQAEARPVVHGGYGATPRPAIYAPVRHTTPDEALGAPFDAAA